MFVSLWEGRERVLESVLPMSPMHCSFSNPTARQVYIIEQEICGQRHKGKGNVRSHL